MLGSSNAKARQTLTITSLCAIFLLSLIIMGTVGVNGKITVGSVNNACLLYMSVDGDVVTYNNGLCLFPIVGAAITAFFSLILLLCWVMVVVRKDEFSPRNVTISFLATSMILALLSFAICGAIGIGLNKGCNILGDQRHHCHSARNFSALYGAEICAGLMGGLWLIGSLLEFFQLRSMPRHLSNEFDYVDQTRVTPQRAGKTELSEHPEMVSTPQSHYQPPQKQELHSPEVFYPHEHAAAAQSYPPGTPLPADKTTTTQAIK